MCVLGFPTSRTEAEAGSIFSSLEGKEVIGDSTESTISIFLLTKTTQKKIESVFCVFCICALT